MLGKLPETKVPVEVKCHKQAGFSLIELSMVLVVVGLLFMAYVSWSSYKARESEATATGNAVAQYIAAVDAKLASDTVHAGESFHWRKLAYADKLWRWIDNSLFALWFCY